MYYDSISGFEKSNRKMFENKYQKDTTLQRTRNVNDPAKCSAKWVEIE